MRRIKGNQLMDLLFAWPRVESTIIPYQQAPHAVGDQVHFGSSQSISLHDSQGSVYMFSNHGVVLTKTTSVTMVASTVICFANCKLLPLVQLCFKRQPGLLITPQTM